MVEIHKQKNKQANWRTACSLIDSLTAPAFFLLLHYSTPTAVQTLREMKCETCAPNDKWLVMMQEGENKFCDFGVWNLFNEMCIGKTTTFDVIPFFVDNKKIDGNLTARNSGAIDIWGH